MPRLIFIIHQNVRNSLEKPKIVSIRIKPGTRISFDEDDYDEDEDKSTHGSYLYAQNKYEDKNLDTQAQRFGRIFCVSFIEVNKL